MFDINLSWLLTYTTNVYNYIELNRSEINRFVLTL